MNHGFHNPETTLAVALVAGVGAQAAARHLQVPGIIVLLLVGVVLGPDALQLVDPDLLGSGLLSLVGFAVAVILFEGGMNLDIARLRREKRAIRQLVSVGALVTTVGAALAAKFALDWPWRTSILFGTLVIVTGPTVITPLLRRFRVQRQVATVLEAEGVLIDAVGAVIAVVALEIALDPQAGHLAAGVASVPATLAIGTGLGVAGGFLLTQALSVRNLVPEGLENVFTLSLVLALFQISNALMPESGIAAATAAGIVVGNRHIHGFRELLEFKEQLTAMFIGMLFVLLAADVRLSEVQALGWPGVAVVGLLMFVVRPLTVLASTVGTELDLRQKTFLAAIGPRGIVAAAIAALFAAELEASGSKGGTELRALVFLVIVVTVVVAGGTGGWLARRLGLNRATDRGWAILGANELARAMARSLGRNGEEALCIDTNPAHSEAAEREGLTVVFGNGLRASTLARAELDTRRGALALSPNTEVNLLFMRRVLEEAKLRGVYVAAGRSRFNTNRDIIAEEGGRLLFGAPEQLDLWVVRLRRGAASEVRVTITDAERLEDAGIALRGAPAGALLALTFARAGEIRPLDAEVALQQDDEIDLLILDERRDAVEAWLDEHGLAIVAQTASRPPEA